MFHQSDNAFDNEGIDLLSAAFRKAWIFVERDFSLEPLNSDERRSALASCLMELAKREEWDEVRLANAAISSLRKRVEARRLLTARGPVNPIRAATRPTVSDPAG